MGAAVDLVSVVFVTLLPVWKIVVVVRVVVVRPVGDATADANIVVVAVSTPMVCVDVVVASKEYTMSVNVCVIVTPAARSPPLLQQT